MSLVFPCFIFAQNKPYYFDHLTIREGLSHNTVHAVLQDKNGFIWFATQNGLNKYDGYSFKMYGTGKEADSQFEGHIATALLEDKQGNLWVGTQKKGINILSASTGRFQNLRHQPRFKALSDVWVYNFFQDRTGNIWIATLGDGAFRYNPTAHILDHFQVQNGKVESNYVFDFTQDEKGTIWAVTGQTHLSQFSVARQKFEAINWQNNATIGDTDFSINGFRKTISADQSGNLWIGTEQQGLLKYQLSNGAISQFQTSNIGATLNGIRDLEWDHEKNLLIATDGGGLNILDRQTQTIRAVQQNPLQPQSLNTNALYDLCVTKDGSVWIGTFNGGVNVFKAQKIRFESYAHTGYAPNEISHSSVLSLLETKDGRIWAGTDGGGLNLFDPKNKTFTVWNQQSRGLGGNIVKTLYEDAKGYIWIGFYEKGMDRFDPKTNTFKHFAFASSGNNTLSNTNVWSIVGDSDGTLWIGTLGGGLNHFDPATETFTHFEHDPRQANSISSNDVMSVFRDTKGRIWVGTQDKGLNLWDANTRKFRRFRHDPQQRNSLSGNEIRAIFEDKRGNLWIGTEDGGLNLWQNGTFKQFSTQQGFISNSIMGITADAEGHLWISTTVGLSKFDPQKNTVENFNFHKIPQANQFNQAAILHTRSGNLMIGGINSLNVLDIPQTKRYQNILNPPLYLTDFKIFNHSILAGKQKDERTIYEGLLENVKTLHLSYLDNAFSFDFATLDFNEPQNNRFIYKLEGFHQDWQTLSLPQHSISFTNLAPETYLLRIRGTNSIGQWSAKEIAVQIIISPPFWKTLWFRFLMLLSAIGSVFMLLRLFVQRRERHLKAQMMESEREILQLRNEKLATELESKSNQLVSLGLQMAHKNDFLNKVKKELHHSPSKSEESPSLNARVMKMIESEVRGEDFWKQFNDYFNQINNDFTHNILQKHPYLSANDLKICALIVTNLNTKEMASILNITPKGIEKSRYRLKKKLELTPEDDLSVYLKSFNTRKS